MLAGGPAKVASTGMDISAITAAALLVREKTGKESVKKESKRAIWMGLARPDTAGANLLYSLGGADAHYSVWDNYSKTQQQRLVEEILVRAADRRSEGGKQSVEEESRRSIWMGLARPCTTGANLLYSLGGADAHYPVWGSYSKTQQQRLVEEILVTTVDRRSAGGSLGHVAQSAHCDAWQQALYKRLMDEGHGQFDVGPWSERIQQLMRATGPSKKKDALLGHGLLPCADFKDAMRNFKESDFYPERETKGTDKKAGTLKFHEEEEVVKLQYVCHFPFPNQDNKHPHALWHRISSCLYYLEVSRLDNARRVPRETGQ